MSKSVPIVIYQMGKVGSTAIYNALNSSFNDVYQVHSLVPEKLEKTMRILNEKGLGIPKHVRDSNYLIEHYIKKGLPIKFITPIRAPLQRNMSAFFQELSTEVVLKDELRKGLGVHSIIKRIGLIPIPNEWKNLLIQKIIQSKLFKHIDFLIEYFKANYRHHIPLEWFDVEFKAALKIDVYQYPFDNNSGFQTYNQNNLNGLVFKSELDNAIKSKIIGEFLGDDSVFIKSLHKSERKSYGKAYGLLKEKLSVNDLFVGSPYLQSTYSQKFYPESNI